MVTSCGPCVSLVQLGGGAEDWFTLVRQVSHVGELMAVEFKNGAQCLLFVPLTAQAARYIVDILKENVDLALIVECFVSVLGDVTLVLSDLLSIGLEVELSLRDSLRQLEHLESECLNRDDLVRVDIYLLLIAFLISKWRL